MLNIAGWAEWLGITVHDPEIEKLVAACARWCRKIEAHTEPRSWLTLMGPSGVGKTHCARALWRHLEGIFDFSKTEYIARLVYWPALISDASSPSQTDRENAHRQIRDLARWPLLVLDDVGAEFDSTGRPTSYLNTLLNQRVGKWTIITSNLDLEQLAKLDPRIADRIIREPNNEYVVIKTASHALRNQTPK